MWGLLLILSWTATPLLSWHPTRAACEAQAAVELHHAAVTAREVLHVECRAYAVPVLRPITGEIVTR